MIRITVYYDGKAVQESEYAGGAVNEITIGRAPGCVIRLDEATVSRLHAVIQWSNGTWILQRKASFGAVRVNGEDVENAVLQGGEEISIGKFALRVHMESAAAARPSGVDAEAVSGVYRADEDGQTRAVNLTAVGFFRIDPGMANVAQYGLEKESAVFGRASNCDVILLEKKSSRKHFEVRRQGLTYYLKDLSSANGTYVNGRKVDEVELNPGDEIRVGETLIKFSVEDPKFFEKQGDFLPVPMEADEGDPYSLVAAQGSGGVASQSIGAQDFSVPAPEPESKSIIVKLYRKYKALPVGRRYLVLLVILAGVLFLFDEAGNEINKTGKQRPKAARDSSGRPLRVYENLKPDRQKLVDKNYMELRDAFDQKNYNRVLERVTTILNFVDDYKETKFYEARAKQALEKKESEEREKEQRARQQRIREEVAALEQKGAPIYKKALENPASREALTTVAQEIFSKDPSNRLAQEWLEGLKEKEAEENRLRQEARKKELRRQKAEQAFLAVEKIFTQEKYLEAIDRAEKLKEDDWTEPEYLARVDDLLKRVRDKLDSIINPLMNQAEEHRKPGGDLVKAKDQYLKVLEINPKHEGAIRGLDSIREVLHLQAKRLYAEAILAESVSDLTEAKEKFGRCEKTAPEGDIYKQRCRNKLLRYESFTAGDS